MPRRRFAAGGVGMEVERKKKKMGVEMGTSKSKKV